MAPVLAQHGPPRRASMGSFSTASCHSLLWQDFRAQDVDMKAALPPGTSMNETVRGYISAFRVRELQAVLEQLGLPKTGRKADLVARVFAFFGEEPPTSVR